MPKRPNYSTRRSGCNLMKKSEHVLKIGAHLKRSNKHLDAEDENIEEIKIKEEIEIDIEDFDSGQHIATGTFNANDINYEDINSVKQEIDTGNINETDDVNHFLSIHSNNNDISKTNKKELSKIIKNFDLKRVLDIPQENITKTANSNGACILCAATSSSKSKSIVQFAKMILDFSGIDILQVKAPPIACSSCIKQLKMIDNFKKQIIYTNNLITSASLMIKNTTVKRSRKSDAWEYTDEETSDSESDDWFTFEVTKINVPKTTSNAKSSETQKVESTVNKNSVQRSAKEEKSIKRKFMCAACGNQYTTMEGLKAHTEYVHEERTTLCHICGKTLSSGSRLEYHMRTHSGVKPFLCSYCKRTFSLKWNRDQHIRLHTNSLPYKCKMCPSAFRHNVVLKKHIVKAHTASECASNSEDNTCTSELNATGDNQNSADKEVIGDANNELQNNTNMEN